MKAPAVVIRIALLSLLLTVVACKPGVPDEYIQPGDMEDILYEYHIAMAMINQESGNTDERIVAYRQAILQKYGYSEAQMDSSMKYYMRHTERLHDIYDKLAVRLNDEAKELGAGGADLAEMETSLNGDTANVWRGATALIMSPAPGANSYSFDIKVDTAFHKGDRLMLEFNSEYIIQEGARNAVAVLAVTLGNDSITSQMLRLSSNSRQTIVISDNQHDVIKKVSGYFLFPQDEAMLPSTTLKLIFISKIHLIRMHTVPTPNAAPAPGDSAKTDSAKPGNTPTATKRPPAIPIPQGPKPITSNAQSSSQHRNR